MDISPVEQRQAVDQERQKSMGRTQCGACGRYFVSGTVFDQHRAGSFDKRERRCLSDEEMRAAGLVTEWRNVRIAKNGRDTFEDHDVWYDIVARERVRKAFAKDPPE